MPGFRLHPFLLKRTVNRVQFGQGPFKADTKSAECRARFENLPQSSQHNHTRTILRLKTLPEIGNN